MIKLNLFKAAVLAIASAVFFTGCKDEGPSAITITDFYGVYTGEHLILGLLPVPDSITITTAPLGADSITLYSLALDASFNGKVTGSDIAFATFTADSLNFSEGDT